MGNAQEKQPSVVNSLMGTPPVEGHIMVAGDDEVDGLNCRS